MNTNKNFISRTFSMIITLLQRKAAKFAIFLEYEKPYEKQFFISCYYIFPQINALVYLCLHIYQSFGKMKTEISGFWI